MKITISTQILSGNLGYGWNDNNDAADALGEMTEQVWLADLSEVIDEGHEIEFDIDVCHNTSGCSRDVSVDVDGDDWDAESAMIDRVRGALTEEDAIWSRFCDSDEAADLVAE